MLFSSLLLATSLALAAGPAPVDAGVESAQPTTHECRRALGLSFGLTQRSRSWFYVGKGSLVPAGSPAFGLTCAINPTGVPWEVAITTAPFYFTQRINADGRGRAWWSLSAGPLFGSGEVRAGPWATVGWGRVGGGGRLVHLPWVNKRGSRLGYEARLDLLYNGSFEVVASTLFVLSARRL
jgi:hypothetical protein